MLAYRRKSCNTREHLFEDRTVRNTAGGPDVLDARRPMVADIRRPPLARLPSPAGGLDSAFGRVCCAQWPAATSSVAPRAHWVCRALSSLPSPPPRQEVPLTLMRRSGLIPANWDQS